MLKDRPYLEGLDLKKVPSPCYVVDMCALERNAQILKNVSISSGAKVLLALKGFALGATFPLLSKYLDGVCASSPHEARFGAEKFKKEVHTYSPAFSSENLLESLKFSEHIIFNSPSQLQMHAQELAQHSVDVGIRINPQYSEAKVEIYDPCAPKSRLGCTCEELQKVDPKTINGLHMHSLCEQGAEVLERTVHVLERDFKPWLESVQWLNLGGGHHITQPQYQTQRLIDLLGRLRDTYHLQVYIEPGEAVAIHTGGFVSSVLDLTKNGDTDIAILDTAIPCHLPDILEMPYRAEIRGAAKPNEKEFNYRLGGQSCLAGDIAGDYSFSAPLSIGDPLLFEDMSHYTMVKTNTFNGVALPGIALWYPKEKKLDLVRQFGYEDFAHRLG
jgi:carboxynorspermidine decarboxylase